MKMLRTLASLLLVFYCLGQAGSFLVGRGFADVTGIAGEGALYGYASPSQDARGLHSRQFSRAFVVADEVSLKRVAVVVAEVCMISQAVRTGVVEQLRERLGGLYDYDNVLLTGTHSHSTPGGFHTYWMYQAPSLGFINETYDAAVLGIVESIVRAHNDLKPGKIFLKSGELLDTNLNRSPYAYDNNPEAEKDSYAHNVEKAMDLLHFVDANSESLGMINFYPVHTTSMKRTNHLISTDNKGYAAQMFEREVNPGLTPNNPTILGAFAQSEEGDATPNLRGDWCDDDFIEQCTYNTSTCSADPLDPALCNSYGPTGIDYDDTMTIGRRQFQRALELFNEPLRAQEEVVGRVEFKHQWVNFSNVLISQDGDNEVRTCRPAMGYSFAAGATDGPGIKPFTQGMLNSIPIIDEIVKTVYNYSEELIECHAPKPILLPTGEVPWPYAWQPDINAMQLIQIGNIVLAAVPGEFTTMAGRRLRAVLEDVLKSPPNNYPSNTKVIIAGISNGYTSYITTWDEYQMQRYEGASTTYGPNTLKMYEIKMSELANAMAQGVTVEAGLPPPDLRGYQRSAVRDVAVDETPDDMDHGDILADVQPSYVQGTSAKAVFVAGNPRNNHMTGVSFIEVQLMVGAEWVTVYNDAHWETRMNWDSNCHDPEFRNSTGEQCFFNQLSNVTITWDIPANQQPGEYRLVHNGRAMLVGGRVREYTGISSTFTVTAGDLGKGRVTRYDHQESPGYGFERPSPSQYGDGELTEEEAWDVLFQVMLDTPW